jgi:hypothetical protein
VSKRVSVPDLILLLRQAKYVYPYHQAIGFLLEKAGRNPQELERLRSLGIRFNFYLDYGMREPAFDARWRLYYPANL